MVIKEKDCPVEYREHMRAGDGTVKITNFVGKDELLGKGRELADALGVKVLAFPELTLTGVTCGDFIRHRVVLDGALRAFTAEFTAAHD